MKMQRQLEAKQVSLRYVSQVRLSISGSTQTRLKMRFKTLKSLLFQSFSTADIPQKHPRFTKSIETSWSIFTEWTQQFTYQPQPVAATCPVT